jgi:hypothetical protein
MQVIEVAPVTLGLVHDKPPTVAVAPVRKSVPEIVIGVPPAVGPFGGDAPVTVGGPWYVNAPLAVPYWPSAFVTDTA